MDAALLVSECMCLLRPKKAKEWQSTWSDSIRAFQLIQFDTLGGRAN